MGADLSCHYCGYDITAEDLFENGGNFRCPSCKQTAYEE